MACIIVRRMLISVHKWKFPGMADAWHSWILVPTWCPPSIFTNFSLAKSHNFFIMEKPKFTEIFNICWKHVPFVLCRSSQFDQMFYINSVNFDFCIMKKCHLCTEISKRRTIMQATVLQLFHLIYMPYIYSVKNKLRP